MPAPFATAARCGANPEQSPESSSHAAYRGISLWFARYHRARLARGAVRLPASTLRRCTAVFFVPGDRAARRPTLAPPAPGETTTAAATESCTASVRVAYFNLGSAPRGAHTSLSLITREIALESLPQLSASFSSWRRPSRVSE